MRYIISGGGGFIGSAIVKRLPLDGHVARIFDCFRVETFRKFKASEHLEWNKGDFLSTYDLNSAIVGTDVVLHLVSTTLPKNSNDDTIYDVHSNLVGTIQILNVMVAGCVHKYIGDVISTLLRLANNCAESRQTVWRRQKDHSGSP